MNNTFSFHNRRIAILGLISAISLFSLILTLKEFAALQERRTAIPFFFSGMKFAGLEAVLSGEKYVGYWTDRDINVDKNGAQFAQAQLMMAPIILDLNNTAHRFTIFDCDNPAAALQKIKNINAAPLKRNNFGIILAVNPTSGGA